MAEFYNYEGAKVYNEESNTNISRTEFSNGYVKQVRRVSRATNKMSVGVTMYNDQVDDFLEFWEGELEHGTQYFDFEHPRTGDMVEVRIIGGKYKLTPLDNENKFHLVSFDVEYYV